MPMTRRPRVELSDDWGQLTALSRFPEQRAYELLRPVVLFGSPVQVRSRQTGTPERTLYRQVALFEERGMSSLFAPPKVEATCQEHAGTKWARSASRRRAISTQPAEQYLDVLHHERGQILRPPALQPRLIRHAHSR